MQATVCGKEACVCVGKLTEKRRQPHARQSCEVTNRNLIEGRTGRASEPKGTDRLPRKRSRIGLRSRCCWTRQVNRELAQ